jgi:hypothetical protein
VYKARAQEICQDLSTAPVQAVRDLVQDLVLLRKIPAPQQDIAAALKKTLCSHLAQQLHMSFVQQDVDRARVESLCSKISGNSVVSLRGMLKQILTTRAPPSAASSSAALSLSTSAGAPPTLAQVQRLRKHDLCLWIGKLSGGVLPEGFGSTGNLQDILENEDDPDDPNQGTLLPAYMVDPVSRELMTKPVVLQNGQTYDLSTVNQCRRGSNECPLTRDNIESSSANVGLAHAIDQWLQLHLGVTLDEMHAFRLAKEQEALKAKNQPFMNWMRGDAVPWKSAREEWARVALVTDLHTVGDQIDLNDSIMFTRADKKHVVLHYDQQTVDSNRVYRLIATVWENSEDKPIYQEVLMDTTDQDMPWIGIGLLNLIEPMVRLNKRVLTRRLDGAPPIIPNSSYPDGLWTESAMSLPHVTLYSKGNPPLVVESPVVYVQRDGRYGRIDVFKTGQDRWTLLDSWWIEGHDQVKRYWAKLKIFADINVSGQLIRVPDLPASQPPRQATTPVRPPGEEENED